MPASARLSQPGDLVGGLHRRLEPPDAELPRHEGHRRFAVPRQDLDLVSARDVRNDRARIGAKPCRTAKTTARSRILSAISEASGHAAATRAASASAPHQATEPSLTRRFRERADAEARDLLRRHRLPRAGRLDERLGERMPAGKRQRPGERKVIGGRLPPRSASAGRGWVRVPVLSNTIRVGLGQTLERLAGIEDQPAAEQRARGDDLHRRHREARARRDR